MSNYKKGSWNVIDDVSGFKTKAHKVRKRWDGLYVTKDNWEPRHPQDFLRATKEDMTVPFVRPRHADIFVEQDFGLHPSTINHGLLNTFMFNE